MRRLIIALIALVGMGATGLAFAGIADGQGIVGSPHDFTDNECWDGTWATANDPSSQKNYAACDETTGAAAWNDTGELCRVCHIPHSHGNTETFRDVGLLWNHDTTTVTTWDPYTSGTLEAGTAGTSPDGFSLACLACHDGIGAIDGFDTHAGVGTPLQDIVIGGTSGSYNGTTTPSYNRLVYGDKQTANNDITTEHPVSVVYDDADPGLFAPTATFETGRTIQDVLGAGDKVQCGSCHEVHNNGYQDAAGQYLLRLPVKDPDGTGPAEPSQLCLGCHDK